MKSLMVICAGLWVSWRYTNLYSDQALYNMVAPIGLLLFVIALMIWLVLFTPLGGQSGKADSYSGDSGDFGGDCSGDAGGD